MASFTFQRQIAAPPQTVFDVLTEHERYAAITPMRKSVLEREGDPAPNGVGAIRVLSSVGPPLREEVIAFRKPVAYVHGDSHYHRVDKPLLDAQGRRLENFTRVETFGDNQANGTNDVNWIKVTVNPRSREVFSYQAQIVPANRVAVPAP